MTDNSKPGNLVIASRGYQVSAAHAAWTKALRIFGEIDHPDRDKIRAKLRAPIRQAALAG